MPIYSFECPKCQERFELRESVAEREKRQERCPKCGTPEVRQRMGSFFPRTAKKS